MCGVPIQKQNTLSLLLLPSHTFRDQTLAPVKEVATSLISNKFLKGHKLNCDGWPHLQALHLLNE